MIRGRTILKWIIIVIIVLMIFSLLYHFLRPQPEPQKDLKFGATFSKKYAQELGLDWKETFLAILNELPLHSFRIGAYWDQIETAPGHYDFSELDWMIEQAGKHDKKIILGVGRKLPRWPECHEPGWIKVLPEYRIKEQAYNFIARTVNRYKDNPAVIAWQVENEPFFMFGECPFPSYSFLKQEIELVKRLDDTRQVIVTDSGEFSTWIRTALLADTLGISMYRVSYTKWFGYNFYPFKPMFYADHYKLIRPLVDKIIISELQAEPWATDGIMNTTLEEQYKSMNPDLLKENIEFAASTGIKDVLVWGVEWWYWLKVKQDKPEMWETGKALLSEYSLGEYF